MAKSIKQNPDIIYTTLCKMQQIYYIHNVVYIINLLDCTQGCVYNINQNKIEKTPSGC